jgi:hypothetical protein
MPRGSSPPQVMPLTLKVQEAIVDLFGGPKCKEERRLPRRIGQSSSSDTCYEGKGEETLVETSRPIRRLTLKLVRQRSAMDIPSIVTKLSNLSVTTSYRASYYAFSLFPVFAGPVRSFGYLPCVKP